MAEIDLYKALEEMKRMNEANRTFTFAFRKWNRATNEGGALVRINEAQLRPKAHDERVANSSYKLYFTDMETGRAMVCWQPLIVEFEGMKTVLN